MTMRVIVAAIVITAAAAVGCSRQETGKPPARTGPAPDPATLGRVSGTVAGAGAATIVVLEPQQPVAPAPPAAAPVMDQVQMMFVPDVLIARTGFPVSFHSSDSDLHNINVQRPGQRFSEFNRSQPPGVSFDYVFKNPGFYSVRCDIHPEMTAEILVTSSPFATTASAGGAFTFEAVPPGAYTLTIYNGAATAQQTVSIVAGENHLRPDAAAAP